MKFFNIDFHISVIADLKDIFEELGHSVTNWSLSDHSHHMGWKKKELSIDLKKDGASAYGKFYDNYGKELEQYDAFIVTYPPSLAMLYRDFNKPIIMHIPIRYEYPYSRSPDKWERLNAFIDEWHGRGKLIVKANNDYDSEYIQAFIPSVNCETIPNLCSYFRYKWGNGSGPALYYSKQRRLNRREETSHVWVNDLKDKDWNRISNSQFIEHYPYNVSTMSIMEQYNAGIPLYFPEMLHMMELYRQGRVLQEYSWNKLFRLPSKSAIAYHADCDPNDYYDMESVLYWLSLADYYNEDLYPGLGNFDENTTKPAKTKDYFIGRERKEMVKRKWANALKSIQ